MTYKSQTCQALSILSLVRLMPECKIMPTRVDFSTPSKSPTNQTSITPSFMNDRCFYTPSFSLPIDIKHYRENLEIEKCQFEEKIQRSCQQFSNLSLPSSQQDLMAVAPNSNYCQICQERFDDYFAHIILKSHQTRMAKSEASDKIHELCKQFQVNLQVAKVKGKTKMIKKQQKRQQKKVKGMRHKSGNKQENQCIDGLTQTQNHSTEIIEDAAV